jgi:serine/threonine-protein kinase
MDKIRVPNLENFKSGIILCPKCSERLDVGKSLVVEKCPSCKISLYMPLLLKDYVLYRPIGGGGCGFVYKAYKLEGGEKYAVKLLKIREDQETEGIRLLKEAETAAGLGSHLHLASVIEYGRVDNECYIIFQFINGERLDEFIKRKGRVSEQKALNILKQLIDAEEYICSKGFLYRDMKPENILIEKNGNIKICDYGLCIRAEDAVVYGNISDELEGSPLYIPPERIFGKTESQYSEIYSLGMILFHVLNGAPYFSETEIKELIAKHIASSRSESATQYLPHISPVFVRVLDKMIAQDPEKRYQSFQSLKNELVEMESQLVKKPYVTLTKS